MTMSEMICIIFSNNDKWIKLNIRYHLLDDLFLVIKSSMIYDDDLTYYVRTMKKFDRIEIFLKIFRLLIFFNISFEFCQEVTTENE